MKKKVISIFLMTSLALGCLGSYNYKANAKELTKNSQLMVASDTSLTLSNDILQTIATNTGDLAINTTGGDPQNPNDDNRKMIYGNSNAEAIKVGNDIKYICSGDTSSSDSLWQNTKKINDSIVSTYTFDNVAIQRNITLDKSPVSSVNDSVKFQYSITNNSSVAQNISFQLMLDTFVGSNDNAPFDIPGVGKVDSSKKLTGSQIPNYWFAYDSLTNPSAVTKGLFPADSKPNVVDFSQWRNGYGNDPSWDHVVSGSKISDSCVDMYWNDNVLKPKETKVITYYYTVAALSSQKNDNVLLSLLNSQNVTVSPNGQNTYDPYETTATIRNIGNINLNNAEMTISVPDEFKNIISVVAPNSYQIGNLNAGSELEKNIKFNIVNGNYTTEQKVYYDIIVKYNSTQSITYRQYITIKPNATVAVERIPLYRYFRNKDGAHFYTTNYAELGAGNSEYVYEGIQCYVYSTQQTGTVPLYRYYRNTNGGHFYTTNYAELGSGVGEYVYEGIQCYMYPTQQTGTVPLYRYCRKSDNEHFYTTNFSEIGNGNSEYSSEGIAGYVFSNK